MGRADRATWAAMGSRWIMKLRHMTAEVVELEDVVIEENRHGEKIYHVYDSVKALKPYDSIVAMATSEDIFMCRAMITRRLRGNTFMPSFRTAHRSLIYARRICAGVHGWLLLLPLRRGV